MKIDIVQRSIETILCIESMGNVLAFLGIELADNSSFYKENFLRGTCLP